MAKSNKKGVDVSISVSPATETPNGLKIEPHVTSSGALQGKDLPPVVKEERKNPAKLISLMNHPIRLAYNGQGMMLSPRQKMVVADHEKLGALPKGVMMVKLDANGKPLPPKPKSKPAATKPAAKVEENK